ncbi:MAG: IPExxxVDY family protein [Salinivirgaceae bacterium]|nr:IPExxxVDY family protein [Salinivirgaceae bacterium]
MKLKLSAEEEVMIKVLAVVSYEPLYRVAWLINQQLGWNLTESETLNVINKEHSQIQQFYVFSWNNPENDSAYYLIQNKGAQGALEPSLRAVDYWLRIENEENVDDIMLNIKGLAGTQMVYEVKPSDLKKNSPVFKNPFYQSNL